MNFQTGRKILTLLTFGCPTYNITHKKTERKTKYFFHCKLEDSPSLYQVWVAQLTGELWSCKMTQN